MMNNHIVGTTQQHLGLTVAIPVVTYSVVLLIRTGYHVRTEVYPPQTLTLDVVTLQTVVG